jgi:tetratricopeptide (TPR) repeat protein
MQKSSAILGGSSPRGSKPPSMGALDQLLAAWRSNPDADSTVALCAYVGASGQESLIREIATTAETWHARDAAVMLAVGRMYLDAGLLPEAQASLVTAGKADANSAQPFRYLGEVLLRRGDAIRAEKVLVRAMQLGLADAETRHWHDRASFYMALQKRIGAPAVAAEVAKALPKALSIPAPAMRPQPFSSEEITNPRGGPATALPPGDEISQVGSASVPTPLAAPAPQAVHKTARAQTMIGVAPPAGRAAPAGRVVMPAAAAKTTRPSPPPPRPASITDVEPDFVDDEATKSLKLPSGLRAPRSANPFDAPTRPAAERALPPLPALKPPPAQPRVPPARAPVSATPATSRSTAPHTEPSAAAKLAVPQPATRTSPEPFPAFVNMPSAAPTARNDAAAPPPAVLLEHLSRVGLFEPRGGAAPAWEQAPRQKARGNWLILAAIVVAGGGGIGAWQYAKQVKAEKAAHAATLANEVDRLLHGGDVAALKSTDQKLSEAFDLDSLSRRAARLWLENRVLRALLLSEESKGIDSAVHRGRTVGLPEKDLAVGRVASFLVENDLAGAAAQLPKWDKEAGRDAYYQLATGAVLERAGDLRAIERYEAARSIDPKLVPADILLARLALLELGPDKAKPVIDGLAGKIGEAPSVRALRALGWVIDPARSDEPPPDAQLKPEDTAKLPAPLACVPPMLEAARAVGAGDHAKLATSLDAAISTADSPALAAGLGFLAIEAGDETLARKAALRAVGFAALYPRARTLAARVALLGGRIDEAQKAVEQLDPKSADVAIVRAVAAYESLEPGDVDSALKLLGDAQSSNAFAALAAGSGVLLGTRYPAPADLAALREPSVPWGELVALDITLATGDLKTAASILDERKGDALRPVHLLRQARLLRYQGKTAEAVAASTRALEGNVTAPLLIELVYDLVAAKDLKAARTALAKYPTVLGPLSGWLAAFVDAHSTDKGEQAQAVARVAKLDLPPDASALVVRLLALRALVVTSDQRSKPYLAVLMRVATPKHPEIGLVLKDLSG